MLFGVIEGAATTSVPEGGEDLVVTVTGPRQNKVIVRKQRIHGIWINAESRIFQDVPSYLAILSS